MGVKSGLQSFWHQVEKARAKTKLLWLRAERGWKDGLQCFRPISSMIPRCMSRSSEYCSETEVQDSRLHEDRPLLKHRASVGFAARQAAKKAQNMGGELRRRACNIGGNAIPTPTRTRQSDQKKDADVNEDATIQTMGIDEEDTIFAIGSDDDKIDSDDEEEHAFGTHSLGEDVLDAGEKPAGPLNDVLSTWGRPGDAKQKVGGLKLGGIAEARAPCTTFYVGTPRDCL